MKHIVSFSGGKDSTAMLLRMLELNMPVDEIIFADTGLEFPEMYEWIDKIEGYVEHKLIKVKCKHTFDDWFYGVPKRGKCSERGDIRGFPLTVYPCWWARDGKIKPMEDYLKQDNIIYLGITMNESNRASAKKYKGGDNCYKFPLIDWGWSGQDCLDYLKSRRLEHLLYKRFKRTGCWLCPKQSKASLRSLFNYYPDLWKRLKQYEQDSPQGFNPNFKLIELERQFKGAV